MSRVHVLAPAKINLGLELLGKRPDGYHEIRTIMAMIGLSDAIHITSSVSNELVMMPDPPTGEGANLVAIARDRFARACESAAPVRIVVTKRIPVAGGLGGASADAAATLLALNALQPSEATLPATILHALAATIGSDVPFFLHGPLALASGTGTEITPLSPLPFVLHALLVTPPIALPNKTATLYRTIDPAEFSDGQRTNSLVHSLSAGSQDAFNAEMLANPFRAAWHRLGDPLAAFETAMIRAGAPWVALSGAGPTLYTLTADEEAAVAIAKRLRFDLSADTGVHVTPILSAGIVVDRADAP